jgi:hypothetical protein
LLAAVHKPENDEQRHHCSNEIGIGNFPRAPMMAAVRSGFFDDNERTLFVHTVRRQSYEAAAAAAAAGAPPPRQACSNSVKDGRT